LKPWELNHFGDQIHMVGHVPSGDLAFGQEILDSSVQSLTLLQEWTVPMAAGPSAYRSEESVQYQIARTASAYRVGAHFYSGCMSTCDFAVPSPNCMDLRPLLPFMSSHDLIIINLGCHGVLMELDDAQGWMHDPTTSLISDPPGNVRGLFVDAKMQSVQDARAAMDSRRLSVDVEQAYVTPENIVALVEPYERIDVLKIDIDTFDCDVILSLMHGSSVRPLVLVIELQPKSLLHSNTHCIPMRPIRILNGQPLGGKAAHSRVVP